MPVITITHCEKCGAKLKPDISHYCSASYSNALVMPDITYEYNDDSNVMMIFIDGEEFTDWWCECEPEEMLKEFKKVFFGGLNYRKA